MHNVVDFIVWDNQKVEGLVSHGMHGMTRNKGIHGRSLINYTD